MPLPPYLPVSVAAVSLLLTGCGGGQPNVDTATADELARRADAVADALASGDGCLALERTDDLRSAAERARDDGLVSDGVASEVMTAAERISDGTSCAPAPPEDDDDDEDDEGKGRGRGRGKGHGDDDDD